MEASNADNTLSCKRFGHLMAVVKVGRIGKHAAWLCQCDCGNRIVKKATDLKVGNTKSCGCMKLALIKKSRTTHGHSVNGKISPTYISWASMMQRCRDENHVHYPYYGGRGISVCERWMKFENFLADMGERPEGKTIDRIDPDGIYEPDNCRWADKYQQRANRRDSKEVYV